ncbi:MAG: hypothetical protein IIU43_10465, partial [Thermoguttaceae bacterium]|nr:hypothetical protein [Thermoguttaceae bacterium]
KKQHFFFNESTELSQFQYVFSLIETPVFTGNQARLSGEERSRERFRQSPLLFHQTSRHFCLS